LFHSTISALFWFTRSFLVLENASHETSNFLWSMKSFILFTGESFWFQMLFFFFLFSRVTFLVAESCLIAGAKKNAYHTKYRGIIYAQNFSCESLRKGIFITGAIFIVVTMVINVYYYMYFTKATTTPLSQKTNRVSSTVGMTWYAWWPWMNMNG